MAIPFALTWRTIRRDDEFLDHAGIEDLEHFVEAVIHEGTKLAIVIAMPVFIIEFITLGLTGGGIELPEDPRLYSSLFYMALGLIVLITALIRAIRRHGFLAPVALVSVVLVLFVYVFNFVLFWEIVNGLVLKGDPSGLWLTPRYSSNRYPRAAPVGIDVRDGLFLGL